LPAIVFSLARTAVRDVVVGGQHIVEDGEHRAQDEIIERFKDLQRKLWR
jgi:formimidoylglutamate deiminase